MVLSTPASAASPSADHQKCDRINKRSCANSSIRGSPSAKSPGPSTSIPQPSIAAARRQRACELLMSVFRPSQPHRPATVRRRCDEYVLRAVKRTSRSQSNGGYVSTAPDFERPLGVPTSTLDPTSDGIVRPRHGSEQWGKPRGRKTLLTVGRLKAGSAHTTQARIELERLLCISGSQRLTCCNCSHFVEDWRLG